MKNRFTHFIFFLSIATSLPLLATPPNHPEEQPQTELISLLGEGGQARTYLAQWNGIQVAVKILKSSSETAIKSGKRERHILRKLTRDGGHPQIVGYLGYDPRAGLILELMQGDLWHFAEEGRVSAYDWHNLLTQIFLGLTHVHDNGYVFGDLKPDNILCSRENGLIHFKLTDFGWSRKPQSPRQQGQNRAGSLAYMAPEVFFLEGYNQGADIWSAGVLIGAFLSGFQLDDVIAPENYDGRPLITLADNIAFMFDFFSEVRARGHIDTDLLSGPYKTFVDNFCAVVPEDRPSAREALESLRTIDPAAFVESFHRIEEPTIIEPIGDGATATTYSAEWAGYLVALKVMKAPGFDDDFNNEVSVLRRLHAAGPHPQIVELYQYIATPERKALILEILDTDLFEAIQEGLVDSEDVQDILIQVFEGLAHIHRCGLVYNDLKPENILCKLYESHVEIKLADFGGASVPGSGSSEVRSTLEYIAPEVIAHDGYDQKADIWSAGILIGELCGFNPQIAPALQQWGDMTKVERADFLKRFFNEAKKRGFILTKPLRRPVAALVKQLCELDPTKRPTAEQALVTISGLDSDDFKSDQPTQDDDGRRSAEEESATESEVEIDGFNGEVERTEPISFDIFRKENINDRLSNLSEKRFGLPKETKKLLAQLDAGEEQFAKARIDDSTTKLVEAPSSFWRYAVLPLLMLQRAASR